MTVTTVSTANQAKAWDGKFFKEYIRDNRFKRYMGTDENSIIQLQEDLTKKKGDQITISLVAALTGAGQTGNSLLEGQEEPLANYGWPIPVDTRRHAVANTDNEEQKTEIDLRSAAKTQLKTWAMVKIKTDIINALGAIYDGTTYVPTYAAASESQKDVFLDNNLDRVLFGALKSNTDTAGGTVAADFSDSLLTIDASADTLVKGVVDLAQRMAKTASPIIGPVRVSEDEETYVMFVPSLPFRDLKANLATEHQNAMPRDKSNPLWRNGDLMYNGTIIREIPEIASIGTVGAAGAPVYPCYLCGAQAIGHAIAKRWKSTTEVRDYGFVHGVAIADMTGTRKNFFNDKQHGVVTVFVTAAADA